MTTINASIAPAPGGEIISESGGAIISEQRGGFVGIGTPDVIGPLYRQMPQQVRIDAVLRMRVAGLWSLVDRRQTDLAHQPPDPLAADAPTLTP
jgi:hypothetical protein